MTSRAGDGKGLTGEGGEAGKGVSDDALTPSMSPQEYRDEFTRLLEASQGLFAGAAEDGAAFADGRMDADEFAAAAEQRADDAAGLARDLMERSATRRTASPEPAGRRTRSTRGSICSLTRVG